MIGRVKSKANTSAEHATFTDALRTVLQVSPSELKRRMEATKNARAVRRKERQKLLSRRAAARAKRASGHGASGKN